MLRLTFAWLLVLSATAVASDFAIRDGDTVVFLGDSITAARTYGKMVENFTLLRFPDRKVRFVNAGWGGDTAAGGLARLERDVFPHKPTLITVAYGINDIGWGGKADAEHRQKYLDGIRGIVAACKQRGVRVFICSAASTAGDADRADDDDFLAKMCDDGMKIAREQGEGSIDVLRRMRQIQRKMKAAGEKELLHVADGIHLNDTGQTAMAYAILKGLGAPAEVSSVTIDAKAKTHAGERCRVSGLKVSEGAIEFDRLDEGLPLNQGLFFALRFRFIPMPDELNRYMLAVKNLSVGKYELKVNDRAVGVFSADQLSTGVNLAHATADGWEPGGPWEAQAWLLNHLTDSRNEAVSVEKLSRLYLSSNPDRAAILAQTADVSARLETAQRAVAKPQTYRFVLKRQ